MAITFFQWYTGAMLFMDVSVLAKLWGPSVLSGAAALFGPASPRLSQGTMWFDKQADCPVGALLFTYTLILLMTARVFAIVECLNRWILLNAAVLEACRWVLFSFLFSVNSDATPLNTMVLTFMGWNVFYYVKSWYSVKKMLAEAAKEHK